jgi:hypothetical protein
VSHLPDPGLRVLDRAGGNVRGDRTSVGQRRIEVERRAVAVVVPGARRSECDFIAMAEHHLAADPLAVDVRAVQAAEVAEDEGALALLEDAVLFRHDLVEELDGIVGVPAQAVDGTELDSLLPLRRRQDQSSHPVPMLSCLLEPGQGEVDIGFTANLLR